MPGWSRIGRLKRTTFPKLTGGGHTFGGGAGAGALKTLAGRLLCDTYLSARELVKEVDYTLSTLAGSLLQQQRSELSSADVPGAAVTNPREHMPRLLLHSQVQPRHSVLHVRRHTVMLSTVCRSSESIAGD